jgi:hypothetical protein
VLVVTKLDRLGRNSIDVQTTVKRLDEMGVRVHCLALGGVDLTTRRGRQTISIDRASTLGIPLGNQSMICAPSHCVATRSRKFRASPTMQLGYGVIAVPLQTTKSRKSECDTAPAGLTTAPALGSVRAARARKKAPQGGRSSPPEVVAATVGQ